MERMIGMGGLADACNYGHMAIVNLMIAKGATDWNWGLSRACLNEHIEIAKLMVSRGATNCDVCDRSMLEHSHLK